MDKLKEQAVKLGAKDLKKSTRSNKKYMVLYKNKIIHFGASNYSDYTIHKDKNRRMLYRKRHSKIKLKNGKLAYKTPSSPAYWSWHLLW